MSRSSSKRRRRAIPARRRAPQQQTCKQTIDDPLEAPSQRPPSLAGTHGHRGLHRRPRRPQRVHRARDRSPTSDGKSASGQRREVRTPRSCSSPRITLRRRGDAGQKRGLTRRRRNRRDIGFQRCHFGTRTVRQGHSHATALPSPSSNARPTILQQQRGHRQQRPRRRSSRSSYDGRQSVFAAACCT